MDKKMKSRLPPFTEALMNHTKEKQFPFDTPGHHGGAFYNLTEEGKAFTRFYGNAMFAADVSDSGNNPGDPSSHEGAGGSGKTGSRNLRRRSGMVRPPRHFRLQPHLLPGASF